MSLSITKLSVGPMDNNAYLLRCTSTGAALLVDAANEPSRLLPLIGPEGISSVVTTHRHPDHWQALAEVVSATGAESLAHPADAPGIPVVTGTLVDGEDLRLGDLTLSVIHLVGHTPGSIALYYGQEGGHLFTGDALFPGGPGRTTNPTDFNSLMDDLEEKVFGRLPDETVIHPGHGKDSTLGTERPSIPEWRARGW
ncbi:MBL fold metallo-hydrolase [Dactylosporangium sucinum]|uniref:Zn-dependent hydrolase n=1 Tax=Dactylosporangium sucinum TaxID=1424081 RepID=A0A917T642_9ACTN|nr:MBL fold metallo-hydrolase [Dactylosporangium sucinum]GGM12544.1 Zn-dependent hydrolase [Dactylosporangium sucinum]